ncbi:dihydrofolate reductase family protein [Leifsonia sp. NPDC058248]|uniref:dihydrofolate reductase family protein n=1 Tax=Leifsonia sp. NPDC058248 TaxID=3346402 RepID=UPI0036D8600A
MTVFIDITVSLDGVAAGPEVGLAHPLGLGGGRLHRWIGMGDEQDIPDPPARAGEPDGMDAAAAAAMFEGTGAFVMGRTMFDVGIDLWGPDGAFGAPVFVLTHRTEPVLVKGPTTFTFVTEGLETAIRWARDAARGRDICVVGGPTVADAALRSGLVDELVLHIVPVIFGEGTRLFGDGPHPRVELLPLAVTQTPSATHLRYAVLR